MKCEKCDGTGRQWVMSKDCDESGHFGPSCTYCHGSGVSVLLRDDKAWDLGSDEENILKIKLAHAIDRIESLEKEVVSLKSEAIRLKQILTEGDRQGECS